MAKSAKFKINIAWWVRPVLFIVVLYTLFREREIDEAKLLRIAGYGTTVIIFDDTVTKEF